MILACLQISVSKSFGVREVELDMHLFKALGSSLQRPKAKSSCKTPKKKSREKEKEQCLGMELVRQLFPSADSPCYHRPSSEKRKPCLGE